MAGRICYNRGMWLRALAATSAALLVVGVACGDSYDDAVPPDADDASSPEAASSPETSSPSDAGPRCAPRAPFTNVTRVPGIPDNAYCARFSADESIVTYSINSETRQATRGPDGAYGVGERLEIADSKAVCASFSADRRTVYFEDFFNVWVESGPAGGPYSAKASVDRGDAANVGNPFFDEIHGLLYTDYHLTPGDYFANVALGVAKITGGTTEPMRRLDVGFGVSGHDGPRDANAPVDYRFNSPTPSADALAIYFTTTAKPDGAVGDSNIHVATRTSLTEDFSAPMPLEGVNTDQSEAPNWISPDGCRLYFQSNRDYPNSFTTVVYVATRAP